MAGFTPVSSMIRNELPDYIGVDQLRRKNRDTEQRNALAQMAAETDQQNAQSYRAQLDAQTQARSQQATEQQATQAREWLGNAVQTVRQNPALIPALVREGKMRGVLTGEIPDNITPEQVEEFALRYGIAPAAQPVTLSSQRVGGFNVLRDSTGKVINSQAPERPSAAAPRPQVRTLTAQEAEAQGFPKGSVIQQTADGAFKPVYKPPNASVGADAKLRKEAATRLPQLAALDRRMERLTAAVAAISDNPIFSGGVVSEKVLPYTKEGRELNASIAQVKPILTALTRVPGIGSQSDLEARLDSLQYPDAGFSPETNEANAAEITAFIADLSAAYQSLLSGGEQATTGGGQWSVEEAE
jgi:hypothetical protein